MNYRIIVLLGLFVFYFQLGAQEKRNVDSLYKRLAAAKSDTLRANLLTDISTQLYRNYPDSSMALAKRVFELSSNSNYKMGKGRAFYCMGLVQQARGKFDESINYLNQAQVIFEELKRPKELSSVYNTKGLSYYGKNEIPDALSSYYESIKMSEKINDIAGQATANGNVGLIYYEQNNYDKCIEYWNLALSLDEKIGNIKGIARHTGNIANIYKAGFFQPNWDFLYEFEFKSSKFYHTGTGGLKIGTGIDIGAAPSELWLKQIFNVASVSENLTPLGDPVGGLSEEDYKVVKRVKDLGIGSSVITHLNDEDIKSSDISDHDEIVHSELLEKQAISDSEINELVGNLQKSFEDSLQ